MPPRLGLNWLAFGCYVNKKYVRWIRTSPFSQKLSLCLRGLYPCKNSSPFSSLPSIKFRSTPGITHRGRRRGIIRYQLGLATLLHMILVSLESLLAFFCPTSQSSWDIMMTWSSFFEIVIGSRLSNSPTNKNRNTFIANILQQKINGGQGGIRTLGTL